jgi:hypothetical protein
MTALRLALEDYLALRRSMGFKLARAEKLLGQFVDHCDTAGAQIVTADLALHWAALPDGASRSWVCHRLCVVRGFSRYLVLQDERTEVVPTSLFPHRATRVTPFLKAAQVVGDDFLARASGATVDPDSWTHGSSAQRMEWFTTGYEDGTPDACNTFLNS